MHDLIFAVVVTHNRVGLLKQCIQALRNQVKKVDQIIVINNGSTDDTAAWLTSQSDITVITQENRGGAAGFCRGMKEAYKGGADWVWIMDDDAFPDENCLSRLTSNSLFSKERNVLLSPVVIEGREIDCSHRGFLNYKNFCYPLMQERLSIQHLIDTPGPIPISFASFIGILVGRNIIEKVGFPDDSYFIFNDDVEYSIRIARQKLPMYLIKDAIVFHRRKDDSVNINGEDDLRYYHEKTAVAQKKSDREIYIPSFIGKRNLLYTVLKYEGMNLFLVKFFAADLKDFVSHFLYSGKINKWKLLRLNYQAYKQGITGKFKNERFLALQEKKTTVSRN